MAKATAPSAGYSGTPLLKKLGYTAEHSAALIDVPKAMRAHLTAAKFKTLAETTVGDAAALKGPLDAVHLFAVERNDQSFYALHAGHGEDAMIDTGIIDRAAKRPSQPVFPAFQWVEVIFDYLLNIFLQFFGIGIVN